MSNRLDLFGPTERVEVGLDVYWKLGDAWNPSRKETVPALVDTGATLSCIDSMLAARLGLPVVGEAWMSGIGGVLRVSNHLAQVFVPSQGFIQYGSFAGVHMELGGQIHRVILGRSFLRAFKMEYDGPAGTFKLFKPSPSAQSLSY